MFRRDEGESGRGKKLLKWERERSQFFRDRGIEVREWERKRVEGGMKIEDLVEQDKKTQKEQRWERIREERFSRWYGGGKRRRSTGVSEEGMGRE